MAESLFLPGIFDSVDSAAKTGQTNTRRLVALELAALVVAAAGSVAAIHSRGFDLAAGIGALGFLVALVAGLARGAAKPERQWYEGRAAAESIKSLSWLYAVGGEPFAVSSGTDPDSIYIERVSGVVDGLRDLERPPSDATRPYITSAMKGLRAASLEQRRARYLAERVDDQISWYSKRATQHGTSASRLARIAVIASIGGLVGGVFRFFTQLPLDLLGLGAAIAGTSIAWAQANQYRTQNIAYVVTADDLQLVRASLLGDADEDRWAALVNDAEEAISREHTLWLARRGVSTTH